MKFSLKLSVLIAFIILFSCEREEEIPTSGNTVFELPTIIPRGNEQYLTLDSDYLFDQDKLHTFELKLSYEDLAILNSDPTAEEYVEGMLIFERDTISPVGIRYKGSIGAFVGCVTEKNGVKRAGYKTCTKLSMKVKINWEEREERFYDLRKLQFHSMNKDKSQMHERLGYWLFREMGVPAPRCVHARLIVNGSFLGLIALVEQIDGRFAKYNFDDGEGNVYKEVWPLNADGDPRSISSYLEALETNEDENPSVDIIRNFAQSISDADPEDVKDIISGSMDITETISYAVVDRAIRHDDGPFHWYCNSNNCWNHNYYWYEEPVNKKLHLIPWDMDLTFFNIISVEKKVIAIADSWGQSQENCSRFEYSEGQGWQRSAACDKLINGWTQFDHEYDELKSRFMEGPFSADQVNSQLEIWSAQIRNATIEADNSIHDAVSVSEWESAVDELKVRIEYARNH
jgi:spore coat protein CotH